jgi:hypothetical protein
MGIFVPNGLFMSRQRRHQMSEVVQVKAMIPRALKRQAFSALALRDENFSGWVRVQLEQWVHAQQGARHAEPPAAAQMSVGAAKDGSGTD